MPRCGSAEKVIITAACGFCMNAPKSEKLGAVKSDVLMNFCALGATTIARIHGSLKMSPGLTWAAANAALDGEAIRAGRPPLRLTATVVSGSTCIGAGSAATAERAAEA